MDADVVSQINRGNQEAATKLKELSQTADVWISQEGYNAAVVNRTRKDMAAANKRMFEELNIKVGPPESISRGKFRTRVDVYEKNIVSPSAGVLSQKLKGGTPAVGGDVYTAAQAKAADAEVWSFDAAYRNNPEVTIRLGVKVAPESKAIAPLKSRAPEDWRVGRKALQLPDIEIASDGTIGLPRGPRGGGAGGGGGAAPMPTSSARTNAPAKGTPAPKLTGEALPGTTSTGGVRGGRSSTTSAPAATTQVKAELGPRLEPVIEATPGFNPGAGALLGGAVQMMQAMQFANLQQGEIDRFQKRLAELQPKIDTYLGNGYSVELILIVEKPNSLDFFCASGVFCDQSQFIYFHDLYINYVASAKPVISPSPRATTSQPTMSSAGGRDSFIPLPHQGGSIRAVDERQIRFLPTRDSGHHCEYRKETLYPQESISLIEPSRPPAQPVKTRPKLDPEAKKALAAAPARVYVESENVIQYRAAHEVIKALAGNPLFGVVKEDMGAGFGRMRTIISYRSDLDKAKAEALAKIVRTKGVPTASAELSGSGDDDPGVLTIWFGRDAEK